jgi:tetratricopeptide (TPR) repeat protein
LQEVYTALARLFWTMGRFQQMIQKCQEAVVVDPTNALSWRALGFWNTCRGLYPEAERALMKALELNSTIPALHGDLILLYSRWGEDKKVAECFERGVKTLPEDWWIYLRMTDHYFSRGRLHEAENLARKSLDLNPQNALPYWSLMEISMMLGDAESAAAFLEEMRRLNPNLDLFNQTAYIELMKGNKNRARALLDACIDFNRPLVSEFEGYRDEYYFRTQIALAYALMDEPDKALREVEFVKQKLGDGLLRVEWTFDRDIIQLLSFVYALTDRKEEAVTLLDYELKNHIVAPALIRQRSVFGNLAGYPPFEELMK